ncbi:hypothetical protein S40293_10292 [Stachybotrys chartarum IBT 40293]|nr:hypothetical protein S40293_10292 [Stachybotrys chartarum IBT 40293]
MLPSYLIGVRL